MKFFGLEIRREIHDPPPSTGYDPFTDPFGTASNRAPPASEVAVVEACAGLVSRCFAAAVPSPPLEALTPSLLALIGRRLVLRGECLFELSTATGAVRLDGPAQSHEIYGPADAMLWRYRLDMPTPSGATATRRLPAAAVVHCMVNSLDGITGRSPFEAARWTSEMLARIEKGLSEEQKFPRTRFANLDVSSEQSEEMRVAFTKSQVVFRGAREGESPSQAAHPSRVGPEPLQAEVNLWKQAQEALLSAAGVPLEILMQSEGASAREAFRRLLHTLLEPWGRIVAFELAAKLNLPSLLFDWSSIRGADVQGRARALKSMTDAGLQLEQATAIAGLIDE